MNIGIDIVSIGRLERWVKDDDLLNRVFTDSEKAIILGKRNPAKHTAGRFAAKEAAMKALGTGWSKGVDWKDIEVINDSRGKPRLNFLGNAKKMTGGKGSSISITYSEEFAVAMVVIQD